ncbi:phytoene desaturase family protein [Virgibacillus sp. MG-45]|uniref:phytoene desaturase family protein n=1 Tax=Virgibacillus sp. MG-45 TaxID=3102791 RepID=UPI002EDA3B40
MSKRTIVVGAGPGGLAAAMLLAGKGYDVTVYEKQPYIGGRNSEIKLGDFRFDMGPTFLNMPHIMEELFQAVDRNVHDYLELIELNEMYELTFADKKLAMTRDRELMKERIEELFPGNSKGYDQFMQDIGKKMEVLTPLLQQRMSKITDMLSPKVLRALPELELGKSLFDVLSRYFTEDDLKIAFTFQSKYLGMSPWESPGAFAILSYMEHAYGIYHIKGGLNQLPKAMAQVVKEYGGRIHLNRGVKQLWTEGKDVKGVILESGERVEADEVIVNADFAHAMVNLVEKGVLKKYREEKLAKKSYSCSTFMLYLGLNKEVDLPHHSIIFADDYVKNVEEITKSFKLSDDPSIYVQNAGVTDSTLAPEGKSALYVLVPVPNNESGLNWEKEKEGFRQLVLEKLAATLNMENLEEAIEVERMITPADWENEIFVYKGATFNLGHQLSQMMIFRPHNQFEELQSCWLVGGGTHPGSGLPTILESARITVNEILNAHGKEKIAQTGLPILEHV